MNRTYSIRVTRPLPQEAGIALVVNAVVMIAICFLCLMGHHGIAFWAFLVPSMVLPVGSAALAVEYGNEIPRLPIITMVLGLQTAISFAVILECV